MARIDWWMIGMLAMVLVGGWALVTQPEALFAAGGYGLLFGTGYGIGVGVLLGR